MSQQSADLIYTLQLAISWHAALVIFMECLRVSRYAVRLNLLQPLRAGDAKRAKRYFPFAEGARNCVGQSLGKLSLTATLASLLSRFSIKLADKVTCQHSRPADAVHL